MNGSGDDKCETGGGPLKSEKRNRRVDDDNPYLAH